MSYIASAGSLRQHKQSFQSFYRSETLMEAALIKSQTYIKVACWKLNSVSAIHTWTADLGS